MRTRAIVVLAAVFLLLACTVVYAQDSRKVSLFSGVIGSGNQYSVTGEAEYLQMMEGLEPFGFSIAYLNEGHFSIPAKHHRDGFATQFWVALPILSPRFTVGAGVGPYYWFDTMGTSNATSNANDHGLAVIASANATYQLTDRWDVQLRTNYVKAPGSIDTFAVLGGVGYRFDTTPSSLVGSSNELFGKDQITMFVGETVINNINNKHPLASSIEYRRGLLDHVDWTLAYLDEGSSDLVKRKGGVTELWAIQRFFGERLDLGFGGGAYAAFDSMRDHTFALNGIISMTAGYRVYTHWVLRAQMHRVVTDHDRDSDVFLGGIGYRF